mmetsp:Transcript_2298/g.7308  ORF Transcript_2298/g.7308 Transcript_2298/m.7308 type:complete len:132 (-) Transcript_2298:1739-2134(-)
MSSSSSAAALSQSSLFSEEEGDEIDDGGGNDGGGAPETPNSIDPEWLRRQHFYAAARHRERVLSDEENEYGITNARTRTNRRARRDAFGNVMDDFDDDFDDETVLSVIFAWGGQKDFERFYRRECTASKAT